MTKNIGKTDKIARTILGIALVLAGLYMGGWGLLVSLVGLGLVVTAFIGFCGLYKIFGISTCKECKSANSTPSTPNTPPSTPPTPPTAS